MTSSLAREPSLAPSAIASHHAETGTNVPTPPPSMGHHEYTSPGLGTVSHRTFANLTAMLHYSSSRLSESSSALQATNVHHYPLPETFIPSTVGAQQGIYSPVQATFANSSSVPLHHGAPSSSEDAAQDMSAIFDWSSLDAPDIMDDMLGQNTHRAPPDIQCVAPDLESPPTFDSSPL